MNICDRIINYIKINKVSTTEVADCLGKKGVLPNVLPINRGLFAVGRVKWIYAYNESNWDVHEQIIDFPCNQIAFIEAFNCGERAIVGELVSKYLLLYRQAAALVTTAKMRDVHRILKEKYPVWCNGYSPVGCFNTKNDEPLSKDIIKQRTEQYDGTIMVCDDTGVVIIPKDCINEDFLEKLEQIEQQEDVWFDCIDRLKWNTFDTVCLKKYKDNDRTL